jgi:hypothetical protein
LKLYEIIECYFSIEFRFCNKRKKNELIDSKLGSLKSVRQYSKVEKVNKIAVFIAGLSLTLMFQTGSAQQPLLSGCSSAGITNQPVLFNCDFTGVTGDGVTLHYRGQSETGFNQVSMPLLYEPPFYEFTYQSNVNFATNPGILEYYYSTIQDLFLITQSPKNATNQFPPALYRYAQFIPDASGDMVGGSDGNWLDLTDNGMSYSDTRFYCYLKNVSGTWPQSQFLTYYAYTFGFMITSGPDSSFYALVYANIPLMISSGLYILDRIDSTYTRIGDINSTISSGTLHMACNFSEFTADPAWPGWPPPEGYIIPMGATLTASLSDQMVNDMTDPAIYQPQTQFLNFNSNNPPSLFSSQLQADSGLGIYPRVKYLDQNNNLPMMRTFHFDSESFTLGSLDHFYSDTSEFETALPWPGGEAWHHYYYEFSDGVSTAQTALDSIRFFTPACDYTSGDINGSGGANGIDVVYGVSFLKGGAPPPIYCDCSSHPDFHYVAGDVNGSCSFNGIDITYFVTYLKSGPALTSCPDCPSTRLSPLWTPKTKAVEMPVPAPIPARWPVAIFIK